MQSSDVFGEHAARIAVSSTKSIPAIRWRGGSDRIGIHGAGDSQQRDSADDQLRIPPTRSAISNYVPNRSRPAKIRLALKKSFGFGGTNTTVAFRPRSRTDGRRDGFENRRHRCAATPRTLITNHDLERRMDTSRRMDS